MNNMLTCPACNEVVTAIPFKSWRFGRYDVTRYECQNCKSKFNFYQSPKRTFTIPHSKQ